MNSYRFGRFELRCSQRQLLADGEPVAVGARGFELLLALLQRRDRLVSREELLALIWPGLVVEENNLRQQVSMLRRVLGTQAIATVPGRGYRFCAAVDGDDAAAAAAQRSGERPTVAVLPFAELGAGAAQEYFADGMTQDIITALSKHRWLTVIARNTVFGYKNMAVDIRKVSAELGAQYVVEGSVRRSGGTLRVAVELVDAANASTCWSERYDRDSADVFEVQDEITSTIVGRLEPEIGFSERQRVARAAHADLRAWECFHLGVWHFFRFTAQDNREALRLLQRSRELDPSFGEAHAWWAYATLLDMVYWDAEPRARALEEALAATQQALALDDQNAVFYALKGRVQLARGEYDSAQAENEIAIGLNPTLAAAHCGLADTLAYQGRYAEAIERFTKALQLSPRDPQRWAFLTYGALALIFQGDFERAVAWTAQAREIPNCQYWTLAHEAVALAGLGRGAQAGQAVARLLAAQPRFSIDFARRKLFYIRDPRQLETYVQGLRRAGVPAGAPALAD